MLHTLSQWVDEVPPSTQALRYGNPAFRIWHARVGDQAERLMGGVLPPDRCLSRPSSQVMVAPGCNAAIIPDYHLNTQSASRAGGGNVLCGQLRQRDPHRLRHRPRDHIRRPAVLPGEPRGRHRSPGIASGHPDACLNCLTCLWLCASI